MFAKKEYARVSPATASSIVYSTIGCESKQAHTSGVKFGCNYLLNRLKT